MTHTRLIVPIMGVLFLLAAFILSTGCNQKSIHRFQTFAFGTLIEIKVRSEKSLADKATTKIFSNFDRMHSNWHAWQPSPLTAASQALSTGEWFTPDSSVAPLIKLSKKYAALSQDLFNPAIGKLIQAWGFQDQEVAAPPTQAKINTLLEQHPSMADIDVEGDNMRGSNKALQLDLGAIAKGYAVDQGIQILKVAGIQNALINAGGDLCGIGNQGTRPWRIGIRDPSGSGIIASIELKQNECVFTSGDYERYFDYQGKRYHHIIDPRTGYPADQSVSVTVLHSSGALADAASTALFVAGPDEWRPIASKMGISNVMIIDKQGNIIMTSAMQQRIQIEEKALDRKVTIVN